MTDDRTDELLVRLVSDAVTDVEPRDVLADLRARTRTGPAARRRPWLFAAGGAVLATAAVITAIALATGDAAAPRTDPGPGASGSGGISPEPQSPSVSPSVSPSESTAPAPARRAIPAYYLGDTARGTGLYREFEPPEGTDPLSGALIALTSAPSDPDYRTPWPAGAFAGVSFDGVGIDGSIRVTLADASLHDRPAGMSADDAVAAIQQVVYTLQAAVQARAPVQFLVDGNPIDRVYGVPTSEPLTSAPPLDVLSHVSLTTPAEGQAVSGALQIEGVANSFEANIRWQLLAGGPVKEGSITADGYMGEKLFPFSDTIDLSDVPPGRYVLLVETDDPSGGAEGFGPDRDTRTVVVP